MGKYVQTYLKATSTVSWRQMASAICLFGHELASGITGFAELSEQLVGHVAVKSKAQSVVPQPVSGT